MRGVTKAAAVSQSMRLTVRDITKHFGGPSIVPLIRDRPLTPVLEQVSFDLGGGQIMVLRGANGSGKTTLLRIIAGLVSPDSGTVEIDHTPQARARGGIGFSSGEERSLYWRLSAAHNLEFFGALQGMSPAASRKQARELLHSLGLGNRLGLPVRSLSSGQKQRVLVGRALMGAPAVVLLDEPTGRMDDEAIELVWTLLRVRARDGAAIVMASHDDGDEARADVVGKLADGGLACRARSEVHAAGSHTHYIPNTSQIDKGTSRDDGSDCSALHACGSRIQPGQPVNTVRASPVRRSLQRYSAFFRRDLAIARSYPLGIGVQLGGSVISSASLFFLSHVVGHGSQYLQPYGGNYFAFAVVGTAAFTTQILAMRSFSGSVRESQLTGTLEAVLATHVSLTTALIGSALWDLVLASVDTLFLLAVSMVIFGMRFHDPAYGLALVILAINLGASLGLGMVEAAVVLIYKRASPINVLFVTASQLLGGVIYPIGVMPGGVRWLAALLPVTHSANALRFSLISGNAEGALVESAALFALAVAYVAVGFIALRTALSLACRTGTLGQY